MRIGIDNDNVLADTITQVIKYFNKTYNKNLKIADITDYNFHNSLGWSDERLYSEFLEFYKSKFSKNIRPLNGSQRAVEILANENELMFITSRPEEAKAQTNKFIERYFPETFSDVYFSNKIKTKGDICKERHVDVIIEDASHHAIDCMEKGTSALIFDYPWNSGLNGKARRVYSWKDILEELAS